ncbi:MAG: ferritin family protein [Deltaproteobacteria bacterium]|nr:ferritin family protein [Deltaproteobacteria bacterium]
MFARVDFSKLAMMDALDLAILIEDEAFERYVTFAEQIGRRYVGDAASVFQSMSVNERKHGEQLLERRRKMFGDKPRTVTRDDVFDVEAPDLGAVRQNMSTLEALNVSLEAEKKAYAFYDRALEHMVDPEVRKLFVELRDEETEHVQLISDAIAKLPPEAAQGLEDLDRDEA